MKRPLPHPSLLRSIFSFSSMTLVSRILGLVRDIVLARWFGATAATDAFFVAFKIPNFLRRLFAEGSFSLAFVPVLSEYRERGDQLALKSLIDATAGSLFAVLLAMTGVGMLAAPVLINIFAPGFADDPEQQALAADMLRVTFPYLLFIALTALSGGILNTLGRFALPALTPALLNICLIVAAIAFSSHFDRPVTSLAWAVLVAGVLQLALQLPVLARHGVLPIPRPDFSHPGVRRIMKLMIPTLFGSSVAQINLLLDVLIASLLVEASISWLYYGDRLMEFPLGMFGVALAVVILPTLSSQHSRASVAEFRATLNWAVRLGLVIGLPAAAGLAVIAEPIAVTLFHYGEFSAADVEMTALALVAYCLGLPAFIGVKILAPAFFSRQDTRTPVRIAIIALVANMGLNVVFVLAITGYLAGGNFADGLLATLAAHPGAHAGLALASSASAWINAGLLWKKLRAEELTPRPEWAMIARIGLATTAMILVAVSLAPATPLWLDQSIGGRCSWLALAIVGAAVAYAAVLFLLGLRPSHLARPEATR
ncbi:MAG: murein biosynthesis integral membrane protein MurJ [Wenzhouxiangellaceae bacterium]|nr:murein biosynthesis integral membrane protein MurJ [Wenzhouxiangellaceae bacterium]